jgi:hypothetical protein
MLLDLWGESAHAHDLGHPGAGDALLSGYVGLADDLAGFQ